MRIYWDNKVYTANITVDNDSLTKPISEALLDTRLSRYGELDRNGGNICNIYFELTEAVDANIIINIDYEGTPIFQVRAYTDNTFTNEKWFEYLNVDNIMIINKGQSEQFLKIYFQELGGAVKIKNIYIGEYLHIEGIYPNYIKTSVIDSGQIFSVTRQVYGYDKTKYKRYEVSTIELNDNKINEIETMLDYVGNYKPFYVQLWDDVKDAYYCTLEDTEIQYKRNEKQGDYYGLTLRFVEVK